MENISNTEHTSSFEVPKLDTYEDYLKYCSDNLLVNLLSEEEWLDVKSGKVRFSGPIPGIIGNAAINIGSTMFRNSDKILAAAASGGLKGVTNLASTMLKDEGINAANDFIIGLRSKGNESGSGSSGGGGTSAPIPMSNGGTRGNSNNLLGVYDVDPISMDLRPGLLNRTYTNAQNFPDQISSFSHLSGYKVSIPGSTSVKFFFDNVIIPWLANTAQASVSFRVDISQLSSAKMITYLNSLIAGWSLLYFCRGILSYTSIASNKDRGTHALRAMISAADIDYLNQLEALLSVMPIPPKLHSLLFWLYQSFTDGPNSQSVYRFMPVPFNTSADTSTFGVNGFTGIDSAVIVNCITAINTSDNQQISSILTRITPSWIADSSKSSSPVPIYSSSWMTLFANAPFSYFTGTTQFTGNTISNDSTPLTYYSFDPNLDGLVLGLSSVGVGAAAPFTTRPALGQEVKTGYVISSSVYYTNRFSYRFSSSANTYVWSLSNGYIETAFSRNETAICYQGNAYYRMPQNSILAKGVTASLLEVCALDVMSYICSIDTIKSNRNSGKTWNSGKPKQNKGKVKQGKPESPDTSSDSEK